MRQPFERTGLTKKAIDILVASWRASTQKQYCVYIKKWKSYCKSKKESHLQASVNFVLEFFSELYYVSGFGYNAINTTRSALASFLVLKDSTHTVGTHPIIARFMKGVFQLRPPRPRYVDIWDVNVVFRYLRKRSPANTLSLKDLTKKLCMLIALISTQRAQSLQLLRLDSMTLKDSSVTFYLDELLKQNKPGNTGFRIHMKAYPPDRRLCIINYIKHYLARTKDLRGKESRLFVSFRKPHTRVSSQTISRWIKDVMVEAGIDTSVYKAHSTRAAATSAASRADLPVSDILAKAGWSNEKTFKTFYHKPLQNNGEKCNTKALMKKD